MKKLFKKIYHKVLKPNKLTTKESRHRLVGPAHLWKLKQDFQINFLKANGLKENFYLLDIGCGTLRGGIPIIRFLDAGNYYGIDVRKEVIAEAKKELKQEKLEEKKPGIIHFSEFKDLDIGANFDFVFAFSVLIHMNDEIVEECMKYVADKLTANGVFFANVNFVEHEEGNWQGFPVVFRSLEFYSNLANRYNLKVEVIGQLKDLGHMTNTLGDEQYMLKFTRK